MVKDHVLGILEGNAPISPESLSNSFQRHKSVSAEMIFPPRLPLFVYMVNSALAGERRREQDKRGQFAEFFVKSRGSLFGQVLSDFKRDCEVEFSSDLEHSSSWTTVNAELRFEGLMAIELCCVRCFLRRSCS